MIRHRALTLLEVLVGTMLMAAVAAILLTWSQRAGLAASRAAAAAIAQDDGIIIEQMLRSDLLLAVQSAATGPTPATGSLAVSTLHEPGQSQDQVRRVIWTTSGPALERRRFDSVANAWLVTFRTRPLPATYRWSLAATSPPTVDIAGPGGWHWTAHP